MICLKLVLKSTSVPYLSFFPVIEYCLILALSILPRSHNTCNNTFTFPIQPSMIFSAILMHAMSLALQRSTSSYLFLPFVKMPWLRCSSSSSAQFCSITISTGLEIGIWCCRQRFLNCLIVLCQVASSSTMPFFPSSSFISTFVSFTSLNVPNCLSWRHSSLWEPESQNGPLSILLMTSDCISPGSKIQGKLPRYPSSCSTSVIRRELFACLSPSLHVKDSSETDWDHRVFVLHALNCDQKEEWSHILDAWLVKHWLHPQIGKPWSCSSNSPPPRFSPYVTNERNGDLDFVSGIFFEHPWTSIVASSSAYTCPNLHSFASSRTILLISRIIPCSLVKKRRPLSPSLRPSVEGHVGHLERPSSCERRGTAWRWPHLGRHRSQVCGNKLSNA